MNFNLLEIDINKNAQSWVSLLSFEHHALFYIECNYSKEITNVQLFWFFDWYKQN